MSPIQVMLVGWLAAAVVMMVLWLIQRKTNDAGIVDVAWAAILGALSIFYALLLNGTLWDRVVVACLACGWSVRLALYIFRDRVWGKEEDGRYAALRESRGDGIQVFLFFFFQAQGLLDVILSLSFIIPMMRGRTQVDALLVAAVLVWLVSIIGESVADRQLARFRANPANKGRVCRDGLWKYSRHPNYFFEWMHWWVYVILAIGAPYWWLTLISPLLMLFFILKVTGIPPTEARALISRGDAYREYQRTTSALIPWFPKRETS